MVRKNWQLTPTQPCTSSHT